MLGRRVPGEVHLGRSVVLRIVEPGVDDVRVGGQRGTVRAEPAAEDLVHRGDTGGGVSDWHQDTTEQGIATFQTDTCGLSTVSRVVSPAGVTEPASHK